MKYTKELLKDMVKESSSMSDLMRKLGLSYRSGGMHFHLKKRIRDFGIDIAHWGGLGSNKGKFFPRRPAASILSIRKTDYKEHTKILLRALLQVGVPYKCSGCGITEWLGKFVRLHVEHRNGNNLDNRQENLELLCPNCHTQTLTYGVQKKDRAGVSEFSRRGRLMYGSLTEKLVRCMLLKSANSSLITPSQALKREGVETGQELPKAGQPAIGEGTVQTTNAQAAVKTEVVGKICWPQGRKGASPFSRIQKTKINWPKKEELAKLVWSEPSQKLAIKLGVSESAIVKWCKKYEITKPGLGYWRKLECGRKISI